MIEAPEHRPPAEPFPDADIRALAQRYPYRPHSRGIDFYDILPTHPWLISKSGDTVGGSGRLLAYTFQRKAIVITDPRDDDYELGSFISGTSVRFHLYTKKGFVRRRHPDMFAGRFVDLSLAYFELFGNRIDTCVGEWWEGSDNYNGLFKHNNGARNLAEAAERTWSGRHFVDHGYRLHDPSDITLNIDRKGVPYYIAVFRKPNQETDTAGSTPYAASWSGAAVFPKHPGTAYRKSPRR